MGKNNCFLFLLYKLFKKKSNYFKKNFYIHLKIYYFIKKRWPKILELIILG
jgi:hypothetical protein